ncbi:tetratricopeptide repeat protein [Tranquillimonas alkanivorans]|uniref:TPR repeat-containing protein n=1 Tax=Tranquillimonas alkanivorans TaxID=441119 RepID=A0A1I5KW09_9RHOB|nr:tetratricopeptide repeat protein [Tranquillimonas alkanivorans]SFO89234.1 TPR repeat-containing protein [Tranquillimonas alkanivorans]
MPFTLRPSSLALAACLAVSGGAAVAQDSGAYLAARHAQFFSDYEKAAQYYAQALIRDAANPDLLENAVTSYVAMGDVDRAATVARRLMQTGTDSQVANMVLIAEQAKESDWSAILADMDAGQSVGPLFDGLVRGWALVGEGRMSDALEAFDEVAETQGVRAFGLYHKALALASAGDYEGADGILSSDEDGGLRLTRRGVVAHAEVLSQLGRNDDALALIDEYFGGALDASLEALVVKLETGEPLPFDSIRQPADGVAETLHSIANALSGEAAEGYTILYSQLTEYLRPGHIEALLLTAALLEQMERHDLAIEAYRKIPRSEPAFEAAEMGRAEALRASGKEDAAIEVMQQLIELNPDNTMLHVRLGDTLRGMNRYEQARRAYDDAVAQFEGESEDQWIVYFSRGIANERTDRWDEAEADFRKALDLRPDQPQVLNYLGYSYVEMGENLDEALDMIERAVAARPESGYIADSLGWVLYRLGRYDEAVEPMERAVELMPVDPVINDHLGDVLWSVGREREAEFQWKRALSFIDDAEETEADPKRIRRKLEIGLDAVLEDEGEPLSVADGN